MKQGRDKEIRVRYKNAMAIQTPWKPTFDEKQYALSIRVFEDGKWQEVLHAGYHKYESRDKLKRTLIYTINDFLPMLIPILANQIRSWNGYNEKF